MPVNNTIKSSDMQYKCLTVRISYFMLGKLMVTTVQNSEESVWSNCKLSVLIAENNLNQVVWASNFSTR